MYYLLGISLALTLLLILNLIGSATASLIWMTVKGRAVHLSSRKCERVLFALRALPLCAATLIVLVFVLPGFLLHEPYATKELVTAQFALIALLSLAGIVIAASRLVRTWLDTRRLTSRWMASAEQIDIDQVSIPVYRIEHPFPVIAVVGMFRPRMFVAMQIFDSLSDDEFRSAIAHEYGHLVSRDNFKRAFLKICRDMVIFPIGREIDRAWDESREAAADEYAVEVGGNGMALDLASTLIKIARIVPENGSPLMPLGSFVVESTEGDVNSRVRRLVEISDTTSHAKNRTSRHIPKYLWVLPCVAVFAGVLLASEIDMLRTVHGISETLVHLLQ